jgi:hypothetical protein
MDTKEKIVALTNEIKTFYKEINEENTDALNRLNIMKAHLEGIIKKPTDKDVNIYDVKRDLANVDEDIIRITEYTKEMNEASTKFFASLETQTDEEKLRNLKNTNNALKLIGGGRYHNNTMTMKDIRKLCKDNQIKLSRVVNDKRVVYKKKELLTKLKRKKVI